MYTTHTGIIRIVRLLGGVTDWLGFNEGKSPAQKHTIHKPQRHIHRPTLRSLRLAHFRAYLPVDNSRKMEKNHIPLYIREDTGGITTL